MKRLGLIFVVVLCMIFLSSCYLNDEVKTNQIGVQLDGNAIRNVVGPGIYSEVFCFFCDLQQLDVDTQTFSVEDPEVLTSDNQIVGLKVTIQARRKSDNESVKNFFTNWAGLKDNKNLITTITATAREGMKNGVRGFTLPQLLDDRNGLANSIQKFLEQDAAKYSTEIVNVTIENIALNSDYAKTLNEKAQVKVETEKALQEQDLIKQQGANKILQAQTNTKALEEQLNQEKAQTNVQVEIASREGKVIEAKNKIYETNAQAYELAKLDKLSTIFGDKQVYWFVQPGTDLTTIFNGTNLTPVPVK